MAGVNITIIPFGLEATFKRFQKYIFDAKNLQPAFFEIGEYLIESTQERAKDEIAPDGSPWELLSINTIKNKTSDRILYEDGFLMDTLAYQVNGNGLEFGSPEEYAAAHQFGRDEINLPAREFLGISDDDRDEIVEILRSHLR